MALSLLRPDEVSSARLARWGIYGENGVGKTTFLSTIPPSIPTLVVSADDENVKPLRGLDHVRVCKVRTWQDVCELFLEIRRITESQDFKEGKAKFFKLIAFDTWTRIQDLALGHVVGYEAAESGREKDYISRIPKRPRDWDQWAQVGSLSGEWLRYFIRLPLHVIFLFQEMTHRPRFEQDIIVTEPALRPEALASAKEALDIIGRLYVTSSEQGGNLDLSGERSISPHTKEQRMLLLGKHPRYFAKGPTHKLGYVVESPTWQKIATILEE